MQQKLHLALIQQLLKTFIRNTAGLHGQEAENQVEGAADQDKMGQSLAVGQLTVIRSGCLSPVDANPCG